MSLDAFKKKFLFNPKRAFRVGIERECFIAEGGRIVPRAPEVLASAKDVLGLEDVEFGYELSACQVESRVGPCSVGQLSDRLYERQDQLKALLSLQGLSDVHTEVGPEDMPLDVYPDPTGRYQEITKSMSREVLLAACRIIGTHVHVGMRDHEMALRVYNRVCRHWSELCDLGDGSSGERFAIYKQMAPYFEPTPYRDWSHYHEVAVAKGFENDPRKCWTLIRISVHGTIEFRMFGATDSVDRIVAWAVRCHVLCLSAI